MRIDFWVERTGRSRPLNTGSSRWRSPVKKIKPIKTMRFDEFSRKYDFNRKWQFLDEMFYLLFPVPVPVLLLIDSRSSLLPIFSNMALKIYKMLKNCCKNVGKSWKNLEKNVGAIMTPHINYKNCISRQIMLQRTRVGPRTKRTNQF